ncbi:MAG TPA: nickel-binding protein [Chitinophagaceae bacterium]
MPIYMDVHIAPGVKAKDVAEAHRKDLLHQHEYGCNCMTYWIDEERETIFCLIDAADKDAVKEMHSKAHGMVPNKIIEVSSSIVASFLGRIYDPEEVKPSEDGLKIFSDPSFRILLVTKMTDPVLLQHQLGVEKTNEFINRHNETIRKNLLLHDGSEAEQRGNGFIISFTSASKAISCAVAIQKDMTAVDRTLLNFRIGISGGEPIEKSSRFFGDAIQFANYLCALNNSSHIAVACKVKELVSKDHFQNKTGYFLSLSPQDELLLQLLFDKLEEHWQDPDFDIAEYCHVMAMSQSQLYRKTIALTGRSCNILLKEFRLEKAKELMKKQHYSISQITFESGFTSPSYFTKCFKKEYGLLPMEYLDLLH